MNTKRNSESGQAIILLALAIIVLLGFTALAVDGGIAYSDRRKAQNAVDAAALAGALQVVNDHDTEYVNAIKYSLQGNGFNPTQASWSKQTYTDYSGQYWLVTVNLTDTTDTSFLQVVYSGPVTNRVTAIARARKTQPVMPGVAIMAMGNCVDASGHLIGLAGGGNSGNVYTYDGGMFLNAPETAGNPCALDPGSSTGGGNIMAESGYSIYTVGSYNYIPPSGSPDPHLGPLPAIPNINGGAPVDDPYDSLPVPNCSGNGSVAANGHFQPGWYDNSDGSNANDLGPGTWDPGLYCLRGWLDYSSSNSVDATSGVTLYLHNGGIDLTGQAGFQITAPNPSTCGTPNPGSVSNACTFNGMALYVNRNNSSNIELNGNGVSKIKGMVYAVNSEMTAGGGGSNDDEYVVLGQVIAKRVLGNGNGSFTVTYDAGYTYWKPPELSLER